ncbi:hypothetical protein D3C74_366620 [compost metagenome]
MKMWPTPRANDAQKRGEINARDPRNGLPGAVKMWPTPNAEAWKDRGDPENPSIQRRMELGKQVDLQMTVQGQLNPGWVEALMNFPLGWTEVE